MMETFEVGQKVRHDIRGDVEVTYGPYTDAFGRSKYVVRVESGRETVVSTDTLSAIPEPPKFTVGDKVMHPDHGTGEIAFGPFAAAFDPVAYLVRFEDGRNWLITPDRLAAADPAPIKVGDRVRVTDDDGGGEHRFNGRVGTVVKVHEPGGYFVCCVEFGDGRGHHGDLNGRWNCRAVERVTDRDYHEYDGVTYDLSARYQDRDGDYWTFKRVGSTVRGSCGRLNVDRSERISAYSDTLDEAVSEYGPLIRVSD